MEKIKSLYANGNLEVDDHAMNNRLLFLIPHTFHDSLMEKVLVKKLKQRQNGDKSYCPGKFLKDKILD